MTEGLPAVELASSVRASCKKFSVGFGCCSGTLPFCEKTPGDSSYRVPAFCRAELGCKIEATMGDSKMSKG